jgi:RNA polymerase sigma-70 factor (ECF subfamily)
MDDIRSDSRLLLRRDRRLVKQILAGDERALRAFMDEYFPRLYRYAKLRLPCESDVDDVVQMALTQAARRLETYRGEARLLTWLLQICRHEISGQLARGGRQAEIMTPFLNDELFRSVVESVAGNAADEPEDQARRGEVVKLVRLALDMLPEHYARALELKYMEGLNSREIAVRLHTSDEATQSLLARARRAFREICGETLHAAYADQLRDPVRD